MERLAERVVWQRHRANSKTKVSGTYCKTGCVATAMAQLLYYHN